MDNGSADGSLEDVCDDDAVMDARVKVCASLPKHSVMLYY